jgi:hypothetical protein
MWCLKVLCENKDLPCCFLVSPDTFFAIGRWLSLKVSMVFVVVVMGVDECLMERRKRKEAKK